MPGTFAITGGPSGDRMLKCHSTVIMSNPDSTHTLAQRWANVVHFVGPTLAFNVGPTL